MLKPKVLNIIFGCNPNVQKPFMWAAMVSIMHKIVQWNLYPGWRQVTWHWESPKLKGIVHKKEILSLISHPHVVPNLQDLCLSSEHKLRYFWWNPRAFWPCIDSNATDRFKGQKRSKDKIVHVTSVVQPLCYGATRIGYFLCAKKTKIINFFNHFSLLCHSPLCIHVSTITQVCGAADAEPGCTAAC